MTIAPTQLIWSGCGKPEPFDALGNPIQKAEAKLRSNCARCGSLDGHYKLSDVISQSFVPVRNESRLSMFGGAMYCAACVFCARALRLRCVSWFATESGIEFWRTRPETPESPRPDALATLLSPPEPPFALGLPLYGISHGGENHWKRTAWCSDSEWKADPLIRLQSKHVAIYARLGMSRDRYPVQVDDCGEFVIDRDVWLRLSDSASTIVERCLNDGIKGYPARLSLVRGESPRRGSVALAREWPRLVAPIMPHVNAVWWKLFCELYKHNGRENASRDNEARLPEAPKVSAPTASVPAASDGPQNVSGQDRARSVQFAFW